MVITKRGKAAAQLLPILDESRNLFGCMAGTVTFEGDIMSPLGIEWVADTGEEDHLYTPAPKKMARVKRSKAAK